MIRFLRLRPQPWRNFYYYLPFNLNSRGFSSTSAQVSTVDPFIGRNTLPPPAVAPRAFDSVAYAGVLQDCVKTGWIDQGRAIHCDIVKRGGCLDLFARNVLLNLYTKCEMLCDAHKVFDEMPHRNAVSFVTLIQGCSMSKRYVEALKLFGRLHQEGHELNPFVFSTVLKLLVSAEMVDPVWSIHACICKLGHKDNAFVGAALIDAYSVCGSVDSARKVFDEVDGKDIVSWTVMVGCYAENDCFSDALGLFCHMRIEELKPNNFTFVWVMKACLGLQACNVGKNVHGCVLKSRYEKDPYVAISLLELYTSIGDIDDARKVFEEIPKNDVIPWSFMISRYSQSGQCEEALKLFCEMKKSLVTPNQFTFSSVLQACSTKQDFDLGTQIHSHVVKIDLFSDVFVSNALMDVYAKCGKMEDSMALFMHASAKNEVSWNTVIVGLVQSGEGEKALNLFLTMLEDCVEVTDVTYSSVLCACASLSALDTGMQMHAMTTKNVYGEGVAVGNALLDMYAKCGNINDARKVFDTMHKQDAVSWNAMISAYSMHGMGIEALKMFEEMQETNVKPNQLTFVGVLSACSNTGSLDKGQAIFNSMVQTYDVKPCMEHYTCMVSLLGKMGHLDKSMKLIEDIPFEPSVMVWRALLGASVIHKNEELGRLSAQRVLDIDPNDETAYVLLSNIYASVKRWDSVFSVRKVMKKKRVKKEPGASWIEHQGMVHYFMVGDVSHPDRKLIQGMLEWLNLKSNMAGYIPHSDAILLDVEDDEKARLLWTHSERLALAFALTRISSRSTIRIFKNLRVCLDCHAVIKFISNLTHREIIVRDINRFHHFKDGVCSCGDYW